MVFTNFRSYDQVVYQLIGIDLNGEIHHLLGKNGECFIQGGHKYIQDFVLVRKQMNVSLLLLVLELCTVMFQFLFFVLPK